MDGCSDRPLSSLFYDRNSSAHEFILISIANNESQSRFIHLRKSDIHFSEAQVFKSISVGEDFSFILSLRCALEYSCLSHYFRLSFSLLICRCVALTASNQGNFVNPHIWFHLHGVSCQTFCAEPACWDEGLYSATLQITACFSPFLSSHTNHIRLPLYTTDSHVSSCDPCQK